MHKNIREVTLDSLQKHCSKIHYFGLGFIQVKLGEIYRMHFYTSELPAIVGDEDVHNHRYGFTSHIFFGSFFQEIFSATEGTTHSLTNESCKEGVESHAEIKLCGIRRDTEQHFESGSSYSIAHHVFHRVKAGKAITFLERGPIEKELAEVIQPVGAPKVCPFSKKVPESELWQIVDRMLDEAHQQ